MLGAMATREGRLRAIMCSCEYRWYNRSLGVERTVIIAEGILVKKVFLTHAQRVYAVFKLLTAFIYSKSYKKKKDMETQTNRKGITTPKQMRFLWTSEIFNLLK